MRTRFMIVTCLLAVLATQAGAAETAYAGPCFSVRGRLGLANGNPGFRIWRIGTKRILGVLDCQGRDESTAAIPAPVKTLTGPTFSRRVYGTFRVCPLTKARPGWMQMVCIKGASGLIAKSN